MAPPPPDPELPCTRRGPRRGRPRRTREVGSDQACDLTHPIRVVVAKPCPRVVVGEAPTGITPAGSHQATPGDPGRVRASPHLCVGLRLGSKPGRPRHPPGRPRLCQHGYRPTPALRLARISTDTGIAPRTDIDRHRHCASHGYRPTPALRLARISTDTGFSPPRPPRI